MDVKNLSSNWKKLQETLKKNTVSGATSTTKRKTSDRESQNGVVKKRKTETIEGKTRLEQTRILKKRKRMADEPSNGGDGAHETVAENPLSRKSSTTSIAARPEVKIAKVNEGRSPTAELGKYVAMDCEMVGVGPNPDHDSALARVSIVNFNGEQVYDSFVRPKEMVTDWRTHVSGIAPKHMVEARVLEQVQKDVAQVLEGRILVGHALRNDLDALLLGHPKRDVRDTSKHPPYRKIAGGGSPRLKVLASEFLGLDIQSGAHSSVEDARATMLLYRRDKDEFEREHLKKWPVRVVVEKERGDDEQKKKKKKKKKTHIQRSSGSEDTNLSDNVTANILPCRIHHDGPVESVRQYWKAVPDEQDKNLQTAHFRGRKLRGRRVAIPEGYEGVVALPTDRVIPPTQSGVNDGNDEAVEPVKVLEKQATFNDYVVWGHELIPAADDSFVKGVEEWVKFAEAMHCQSSGENKSSA
ncbi:ribonuclease H-like domain-containing protein [Aspergillus avenaceus]|uniref:RNA exonuclease 4 n=1 Tax=Aspergillus avenaceus TaxID=36643 RepID=A0A5N6TIX8_ASPAV|nr:ribonuclease H-like domain-containing protein [Aspergillus avenaceus]